MCGFSHFLLCRTSKYYVFRKHSTTCKIFTARFMSCLLPDQIALFAELLHAHILFSVHLCWVLCTHLSCLPSLDRNRSPPRCILQCFGQNDYGQLGQGDTKARGDTSTSMGDALGPVDLGVGAAGVISISAGSDHTCVVFSSGVLKVRIEAELGEAVHTH